MTDRRASILTESNRQFVLGQNDPSNRRKYRQRIRERIDAGLYDMSLLLREYDSGEIREAFEGTANRVSPHDDITGDNQTSLNAGVYAPGAIGFLINGLNSEGRVIFPQLADEEIEQPALEPFRQAAEAGIKQYLREQTQYQADVKVSIELNNLEHTDEFLEDIDR